MSIKNTVLKFLPTKLYLRLQYYKNYRKWLNIEHPITYAEKLAYLKVYQYDDRLTELVDKYRVRRYVANRIGDEYLVPLIGVYQTTDDIPWDKLPERYVLKCNHDSGSTILHTSADGFDRDHAIEVLSQHLRRNLYYYAREYPYRNVSPLILCEQYLDDGVCLTPNDYKIMCFNGEPRFIIVDQNRFVNHHRDVYDTDWNKLDFCTDHDQTNVVLDRPHELEKMLMLAKELSKDFKHVRVDFYIVNDHVYFGELTFCPWGGVISFKPDKWNVLLGEMIDL